MGVHNSYYYALTYSLFVILHTEQTGGIKLRFVITVRCTAARVCRPGAARKGSAVTPPRTALHIGNPVRGQQTMAAELNESAACTAHSCRHFRAGISHRFAELAPAARDALRSVSATALTIPHWKSGALSASGPRDLGRPLLRDLCCIARASRRISRTVTAAWRSSASFDEGGV
jgi:hypothetical protein